MISDSIPRLRRRIEQACLRAGRDPQDITVVAVGKNRSVPQIREALLAGITDIGENRVQEAVVKYNQIQASKPESRITWHMVGHLQTNKVREAVKIFDLIHSLDSLRLAEEINRQAARINKVQQVLVEIKTSTEVTKFGIAPQEAIAFFGQASSFPSIKLKGLMTIAPTVKNPTEARSYFGLLKELRARLSRELKGTTTPELILSMGMTDDFEAAIEEGADIIRIGRAIFAQ
jgi:pyridoxal phosphate enzyme (YggS family)